MRADDTEQTPQRNPFNTKWRTNFPSFQECFVSLETWENFSSLGEMLVASSPQACERVRRNGPLTSTRVSNEDFSFLTLEVSGATSAGTPPQPVECYQQSCASSAEQTPQRCVVEVGGEYHTLTPQHLPPLCPNISPITNSPSAAVRECSSAPRTEPQEVCSADFRETHLCSDALKDGMNFDLFLGMEIPNQTADYPTSPALNTTSMHRELLLPDDFCSAYGYFGIRERVDSIIPPLREWVDGNWVTDLTYRYGDFAYHHPLVYRAAPGAAVRKAESVFYLPS